MSAVTHTPKFAKIVVKFERREDGGLRAYSDDVPGFVLSNKNPELVLADIVPTLEFMLSAIWGESVVASRLGRLGEAINPEDKLPSVPAACDKEYVAYVN
ncbi:hypothetical protein [Methylovirgula ligni]|uniref:hypothetical protein n=1 Tax=Methylovirgula ligni TaxID=569860 RepID=UPI0010136240|nr:hypothetical protein [Methylovirgula ligni]